MAKFFVDGLGDLMEAFTNLEMLPEEVPLGMLDAEADVLCNAQKQKAETMLRGPYSAGRVANAIQKGPPKKTADGYVQHITFEGIVVDKYHPNGTRAAEIAYVNEFGKPGQPARPFIQTANEESGDEAERAGAKVYDNYLESKGL